MIPFFVGFLTCLSTFFRSGYNLSLEILALRQQLAVLKRKRPRRLIRDYISYYHTDRTHDGLEKDTPVTRLVAPRPAESVRVVSFPRMGGLHHRYDWHQAAGRDRLAMAGYVPYEEIGMGAVALKPGVIPFQAAVLDHSALQNRPALMRERPESSSDLVLSTVTEAIAAAEQILPGEQAPDNAEDPRWLTLPYRKLKGSIPMRARRSLWDANAAHSDYPSAITLTGPYLHNPLIFRSCNTNGYNILLHRLLR